MYKKRRYKMIDGKLPKNEYEVTELAEAIFEGLL